MQNNPLVTISIPTFNSEKFIRTCLEAVKNQTYSNIEINVIDGSSKDATLKIAHEYTDKIIEYPGALLEARYKGLEIAKGEYILLLDSDQLLVPDTIERAVEYINKNQLDMLVFEEDVYRNENFIEHLFHYDRIQLLRSMRSNCRFN